jgi:hypothetical protein
LRVESLTEVIGVFDVGVGQDVIKLVERKSRRQVDDGYHPRFRK